MKFIKYIVFIIFIYFFFFTFKEFTEYAIITLKMIYNIFTGLITTDLLLNTSRNDSRREILLRNV